MAERRLKTCVISIARALKYSLFEPVGGSLLASLGSRRHSHLVSSSYEERRRLMDRMQDETARVEDVLSDKDGSESLMQCFVQANGVSFEGILDPYVPSILPGPSLTQL